MEETISINNFRNKNHLYNPPSVGCKSFLYCLAYALYQENFKNEKPAKVKLLLKKYVECFHLNKSVIPTCIESIKKFITKNETLNVKVNILYRTTKDEVFPIEFGLGNGSNIINILMVRRTTEEGSENHFLYIKDVNKYLRSIYSSKTSGSTSKSYQKRYYCLNCLNGFGSTKILHDHERLCGMNSPKIEELPENNGKDNILKFRKVENSHFGEYIGFLDFESVLPKTERKCEECTSLKCKCDKSYTSVVSNQKPIGYSFIVLKKNVVKHQKTYIGENAGEHLVEHLLSIEDSVRENLSEKRKMIFTKEDRKNFENSTSCYLCNKSFDSLLKNRDHSHMSGMYLGAACTQCNLRRRRPAKLKIFIHNGSRYDFHFIIRALSKYDEIEKISVLPYNGENFRTLCFNCFEFNDSLAFLQNSLAQLCEDLYNSNHSYPILKQSSLVKTNGKFDAEKYDMLLKKSFFPYEYCTSLKKMIETRNFPDIESFYSSLSEETISKENYEFAKKVWKKFNCKNLSEYAELYCKIDTLLLAEVFQQFRKDMFNFSGLDPAHYISLPSYSFDSMLKVTGCEIELISGNNINMIHFIENGIRGGVSFIGTRKLEHCETPGLEKEIVYVDANVSLIFNFIFYKYRMFQIFLKNALFPFQNLYGHAQTMKLPVGGATWLEKEEISSFKIEDIDLEGDYCYIIECDILYPEKLHIKHNNLPLAPEVIQVNETNLSPYSLEALLLTENKVKYKDTKLVSHFHPRRNYVLHAKNLKLYVDLGMKIVKIHRILRMNQVNFIAPFIDICTKARQSSKTKFEGDQFKKLANSCYGKCLENVRDYSMVKLHITKSSLLKAVNSINFKNYVILEENLVQTSHVPLKIYHNKPIFVGFAILELVS